MSIDEITIRKNILLKTFCVLKENGILYHQIWDEVQERYADYNIKKFGVATLRFHPDRDNLVIQREKDVCIEILKEHNIKNPQKYFN